MNSSENHQEDAPRTVADEVEWPPDLPDRRRHKGVNTPILEPLTAPPNADGAPLLERYRDFTSKLIAADCYLETLPLCGYEDFSFWGVRPSGEVRPAPGSSDYRTLLISALRVQHYCSRGIHAPLFRYEVMGGRSPWDCSQEECREFFEQLKPWDEKKVELHELRKKAIIKRIEKLTVEETIQEAIRHAQEALAIWRGERDGLLTKVARLSSESRRITKAWATGQLQVAPPPRSSRRIRPGPWKTWGLPGKQSAAFRKTDAVARWKKPTAGSDSGLGFHFHRRE